MLSLGGYLLTTIFAFSNKILFFFRLRYGPQNERKGVRICPRRAQFIHNRSSQLRCIASN